MVLRSSRAVTDTPLFFGVKPKYCAGLIGINMANAPKRLLLFSSLVFFLP